MIGFFVTVFFKSILTTVNFKNGRLISNVVCHTLYGTKLTIFWRVVRFLGFESLNVSFLYY